MRGRYVGPVATMFERPVGTVHYGDEFDLPKGREKSFLQHGHIEPADKAAKDFVAKHMSVIEIPIVEVITDNTSARSDK